jgi:hypothetical protein
VRAKAIHININVGSGVRRLKSVWGIPCAVGSLCMQGLLTTPV